MKFIKQYEKFKFNIDDYVKISSGYDSITSPYYKKLLKIVELSEPNFNLYKLLDIKARNFILWPPKDLKKATPEEIEKFLIQNNIDKYNL